MANDDLKQAAMKELATRELARRNQSNPNLQGGANSPANIQAQKDVTKTQQNVDALDPSVAAVGSAYNATWPVSMLANKAMGDSPVPQATTSGGKLLQDMGMMANPLTGEAIGLTGKGISKLGEFGSKGVQFAQSRTAIGKELGDFQKQFGETIQGTKVPIERLAANIGEKVQATGQKLSEYKKTMDDMIFKEAEKSASNVHSKLPTFFRNASTEYGKRLDDIAQIADETGNITRQEAHDLVNNIKAELADNQLNIGPAFAKVDQVLSKYPLEGEESAILNEAGQKTVQDMSQEVIPFKELNAQIREVMKKTSSSFKSGQRVTPEDIAAMTTKEHYGQFLESKLPPEVADSLRDLNQTYKPIAQARKELGRIFKPYNQFSEGEGAAFLAKAAENIAKRDLSEGKAQLLNLLEKGNELTPGIGDVSSRIKSLGNAKIQNEKQFNDLISDLSSKQKRVNDLMATKQAMNKKIGYILAGFGLGGGTAGTVYRSGRNMAEIGK